jgi:integrating conjugative element protein (TIGR03756 family)
MRFHAALFVVFLSTHANAFEAEETIITTEDIVSSPVTDSSCHNYCFTGICFWLRCSLYECSVETSIKVRHYNPDLVVSVYDEPGGNPWEDAQGIYGDFEIDMTDTFVGNFHPVFAGGGHQTEGGDHAIDKSLRFKEATAIGHPLSIASEYLSSTDMYCPSEATPFYLYFSSGLDAWAWRLGLTEQFYFYNFLPGIRVVGAGYQQQWGPVFPRTGFILQKDDAKAAAVIAQRVGNIVTQDQQPHLYMSFDGNNYNRTWLPGELVENDADTGVWQMLAPKMDEQCYVFGENDVATTPWSEGRHTEDNRYAFALWRPYECCEQKGAWLFDIPFEVCVE